ncbi:unnamed protein product [Strongylus vulgaris]|uniref:TFIIS central domain-containing protein n=1 Tax=Strongylus vulgaris TaxID=40348 RepID=A0A3P7J8B5_STRVU|nr:unnamed protein product [Strongylus vulgaris]
MDKVKSAVKLCKDTAEAVEAALFKTCESNPNSPKYKNWTKMFIENVTDCRNKGFYYRVLTGEISVYKVVTLDGAEMAKPEYSTLKSDGTGLEEANVGRAEAPACFADTSETRQEVLAHGVKEDIVEIEDNKASHCPMSETNSLKKYSTKKASSKSTDLCSNKNAKTAKQSSKRSDIQKTTSVSTLDVILGDGAKDTTEQHLTKQKLQAEAERKEREEKEKQREEDRRFRKVGDISDYTIQSV